MQSLTFCIGGCMVFGEQIVHHHQHVVKLFIVNTFGIIHQWIH
jgi:hypothetical protein